MRDSMAVLWGTVHGDIITTHTHTLTQSPEPCLVRHGELRESRVQVRGGRERESGERERDERERERGEREREKGERGEREWVREREE